MIDKYCHKIQTLLEEPIRILERKVLKYNRKKDRKLLDLYYKQLYKSYLKIEDMLKEDLFIIKKDNH